MKVSVVFFSDVSGTAYKAPRLFLLTESLQNEGFIVRFFGIRAQFRKARTTAQLPIARRFLLPLALAKIFKILATPLGRSSFGRAVGNSALSRMAVAFGALRDCEVLFTQPQLVHLIRKAKSRDIPVVIEHDLDCPSANIELMKERYRHLNVPRRHWQPWNSMIYARQIESGLQAADNVIVFSQHARKSLVACGISENKLRVFLPPPRYGCSIAQGTREQPTFVWISNHGIRKGIDVLLKAWQTYQQQCGIGTLHLFGKEHPADALYREELRRQARVIDHGFSDPLSLLTRERSIVVLPTVSEGFPRSVVETMACGGAAILPAGLAEGIIDNGVTGWACDLSAQGIGEALTVSARAWRQIEEIGNSAAQTIATASQGYAQSVADLLVMTRSLD